MWRGEFQRYLGKTLKTERFFCANPREVITGDTQYIVSILIFFGGALAGVYLTNFFHTVGIKSESVLIIIGYKETVNGVKNIPLDLLVVIMHDLTEGN